MKEPKNFKNNSNRRTKSMEKSNI
jgi:hypothetical protein